MSHSVVRGKPNAAQLYLDEILNEILDEKHIIPSPDTRSKVNLSQVLFHCLKRNPNSVFMINAATGEQFTNRQLLSRSVSLARTLISKGLRGKTILLVMRNHESMTTIYCGAILAGAIPFMMDPNTTVYEFSYFLKLIEPYYTFCDKEHVADLEQAIRGDRSILTKVIVAEKKGLLDTFIDGHSDDYSSYIVEDIDMDSTVMLLPTSGSTGLPKAACMTHKGLVIQLPTTWSYHTKFPSPTKLLMLLTTSQWMTFTMMVTTCITYTIPIVMTPKKTSVDVVTDILEKYRPTWTFFSPAFAQSLVTTVRSDQLSSLESVALLGAPASPDLMVKLLEKLPKSAGLYDCYGSTEIMGFGAIPDKEAPLKSNGPVFNFLHYKLVGDNGQALSGHEKGELYLKGDCIIRSYYNNPDAYKDISEDGWLKTGDAFYIDENERLFFAERKKFSFKYQGQQVSPEEIEHVICSVSGVQETVVCASDNGPATAIIVRPGHEVSRAEIHKAVDSKLSDHKRLRGGIVFVPSLPYTHSGKLKRQDCVKIINDLIGNGQCF